MTARVYVGLGSNLSDPEQQVRKAVQALAQLPGSRLLRCSSLYRSPPMGPADQPDYVNAAVALATELEPIAFLRRLQAIETGAGRVREGERWGPRILDLDVLLWDQAQIDEPGLRVPHPGLHLRAFVLYPLAEIAPGIEVPGRGNLGALLEQCELGGLERLAPAPPVD